MNQRPASEGSSESFPIPATPIYIVRLDDVSDIAPDAPAGRSAVEAVAGDGKGGGVLGGGGGVSGGGGSQYVTGTTLKEVGGSVGTGGAAPDREGGDADRFGPRPVLPVSGPL
jgi:hypothetical protein